MGGRDEVVWGQMTVVVMAEIHYILAVSRLSSVNEMLIQLIHALL